MLNTRQGFALLALAIAAALVAGCGAPAAPPATATSPPTATAPPPTSTLTPQDYVFPEVARVSLADAKAAFDEGSAIFVDVRDPSYFEIEHIRGAVNVYYMRLAEHMGELDKQEWIITYCA